MQRSMSRLPKRTIALAAVAGVLVALLSVFVFQVPATAAGVPTSTARTPQGANTYHEQFSGWSYNATVADGNVKVAVEYDKNKSGIEAFDAANRQLVGQVAGPSSITIVFRRPLSISEFQDLVGKTGIQVASYTLRGVDGKGTRSTFSFSPQGKNLVPQALLGQLTKNAQEHSSGALTVKGVVTVDATADQTQIKQLLADNRTFTADVTKVVAAQRAQAKLAPNQVNLPVSGRSSSSLYWFLENTNIVPR